MAPGEGLDFLNDVLKISTCSNPTEKKLFSKLSPWELQNLTVDAILDIPRRLTYEFGISSTYLEEVMKKHNVQSVGKDVLERQYELKNMHWLVSNTNHYSWPKGCALAGLGSDNMIGVRVDDAACLDTEHLKEILEEHLKNQVGVYAVTAIIGSTEEGAVDDLREILQIRSDFQKRGLSFVVHVDAAWGGYFASMLPLAVPDGRDGGGRDVVPSHKLRKHVEESIKQIRYADSVTIGQSSLRYT
jgi:glutamate/tyrosine decarboxylase-like PLP-dependent enzyme